MLHSGELADYQRQFQAIKQDARELVAGMSEKALAWRPEPGRWSIGENLEHLNLVGERYLKAIDECIAGARKQGLFSSGPFRYAFFSTLLAQGTEPPPCRKLRTTRAVTPPGNFSPIAALPAFLHLQDQLVERLERAEGLDLARVTLVSPLMRRLRHSLGPAFAFVAAHERRHLWQAREVRNSGSFCAAAGTG